MIVRHYRSSDSASNSAGLVWPGLHPTGIFAAFRTRRSQSFGKCWSTSFTLLGVPS